MNEAKFPYDYIADPAKGRPLFNADLYYGIPDLDPTILANQIQISVRQEDGSVIPVAQPLNTGFGGILLYNGSPVTVLIDEFIFSFKALNNLGAQIYYEARAEAGLSPESVVGTQDTYADVRALTASYPFEAIVVGGASVVGVGGDTFYYDSGDVSSADNGVTIIVDAAGRRWKRIFDGSTIYTSWAGVLGDGSNESAKVQSALDVIAAGNAHTLIIDGIINCGSTKLVYSASSNLRDIALVGDSYTNSQLYWDGANGGLEFNLGASAGEDAATLTVKRISLRTTFAGGGTAIRVIKTASNVVAPNAIYEDVYILQTDGGHWDYGIHTTDMSDQWFSRCYIMLFGSNPSSCVYIDNNLSGISVFGAYFYGCSFNGGLKSIYSTGQIESLYITDCSLVGARDCVHLDAAGTTSGNPHATIKGCHINGKRSSVKTNLWRAVTITGSDIYSGVGTGDEAGQNMTMTSADHIAITGNKFEIGAPAFARSFIALQDVENFSIASNVMNNASAGGIKILGSSSQGSVTGNTIKGYEPVAKTSEGIYNVAGGGEFTYSGNIIRWFSDGIQLNNSNNVIVGNVFSNLNMGVYAVGGVDNVAKSNSFSAVSNKFNGVIAREFTAVAILDPASIPAGNRLTQLVPVAGAVFGDSVTVSAPYDLSDLTITSAVQAAGIVGVYFYNSTGVAKDLPSGTWKFYVSS